METAKRLGMMDYISLFLMSLRSIFWRVTGKKGIEGYNLTGQLILWLILAIMLEQIIFSPISFIRYLSKFDFTAIVRLIASVIIYIFIIFNPNHLKYSLQFTKSAWWKNTGISPNQLRKDIGLYGEYIATMVAEQKILSNKIYGKVFNNVIVPKRDGDFNEIDIISVNETGIHVIEAKARQGAFYGGLSTPTWTQRIGNEEHILQNPLIQNLAHCNYLLEYLYENLPDCTLKSRAMESIIWNIVLLAIPGFADHLDRSIIPLMSLFGMAETSRKYKGYQTSNFFNESGTKLAPQEIDMISQILEGMSSYTIEQRQQMIQQRAVKQQQHSYNHPYKYYVARVRVPGFALISGYENKPITLNLICRDNGYYKTYLYETDNLFRAIPNADIIGKSKESANYQEVLNYYNRIAETADYHQ